MYGPKWPFLLRYGSRNTRRVDFLRVDGLSTDTQVLGRHKCIAIHRTVLQDRLIEKKEATRCDTTMHIARQL